MKLTADSCVALVQSRATDPGDVLRSRIETFFRSHNIALDVLVSDHPDHVEKPPSLNKPDLVMVLGGDGTFLTAADLFIKDQSPIVGVNTGHLGFLTRIEAHQLDDCLHAMVAGDVTVEHRMMLAINNEEHLALNDVVIKGLNPSRLAKLIVYDGDEELATYDADGLIIATPTGSTAYNLSAGGPIIVPESDVMAITPICPHSIAAKPIVLTADCKLTIVSDERNTTPLVCAVDGKEAFPMAPGDRFGIARSSYQLPLVAFKQGQDSFYALLKRKLDWSRNPRSVDHALHNQGLT